MVSMVSSTPMCGPGLVSAPGTPDIHGKLLRCPAMGVGNDPERSIRSVREAWKGAEH